MAGNDEGHSEARKCRRRWTWLVVGSLAVFLFVWYPYYYWTKWTTIRTFNKSMCIQHLKRISLALENYHQEYGCFPPLYLEDDAGNPAHSWRVLILPYAGYDHVYSRYDFSEPWNGPHNSALAREIERDYPDIAENFCCPSDETNDTGETNYVAIVWPDAVQNQGETPADDPAIQRSLPQLQFPIVEIKDSGIHWMEPRDLPRDELMKGLVSRSPHDGYSHFVTGDGCWHVLERWRVILTVPESDWLRQWPRSVQDLGKGSNGSADQEVYPRRTELCQRNSMRFRIASPVVTCTNDASRRIFSPIE